MGSGSSADAQAKLAAATADDLTACVGSLTPEALAKLNVALGASTNAAFVFIKPHAVTDAVKKLAKEGLEAKGIKILAEGSLKGATIDEKKLIDNHYYAIAVKATIKKPHELNVPNDKFSAQFGLDWQAALDSGKVFNALDGCKELGVDANGMAAAWDQAKKDGKLVKLGGGFYCGQCTANGKELYIMNGFFMSMRSKFTDPSAEIYYFNVEWDPSVLSWADFRNKVLGPTDPSAAPADSLRGTIFKDWQALGLQGEPNTGDNGMHASASPFEGMAERMNWLEKPLTEDIFGKALLGSGMSAAMIKDWSVDAQVTIEGGGKGSIFDQLEDIDASACLTKMTALAKMN